MADIGGWSPDELRRFVVNTILSDPGVLPKSVPNTGKGGPNVPIWNGSGWGAPAPPQPGQMMGMAAMTGMLGWLDGFQRIDEIVLTTAGQFVFNNISQNFRHLVMFVQGQDTSSANVVNTGMRFNGDSTSTYNYAYVQGFNPGPAGSSGSHGNAWIFTGSVPCANLSASTWGMQISFIPYYTKSAFRNVLSLNYTEGGGVVADQVFLTGGNYFGTTNPLTQIWEFTLGAGNNFTAGSKATLYGIG